MVIKTTKSLRGWSKYTPNKSKMADGSHFEIQKSVIFQKPMTYFDEIWNADAHWPSEPYGPEYKSNLKIQDGRNQSF